MAEIEGDTMTEKESAVENCSQVKIEPDCHQSVDLKGSTVSSQASESPKESFRHIKNLSFALENPSGCDANLHLSTLLKGK